MNSVEKSNKNSTRENVKITKKKGKNRKINQQQQSQQNEQQKIVQDTDLDDDNYGASSNNDNIVIKSMNGNCVEQQKNLQINENGSTEEKLDEFRNGSLNEEHAKNPKNQLNGDGGENSKSICNNSTTSKNSISSKKTKRKSINNDEKTTIITKNGNNKLDMTNLTNMNSENKKASCDLTKNIIVLDDNSSNIDENIRKSCNSNISNSKNCQKQTKNIDNHNQQDNCSNNINCNQIDIPKEIEPNSSAQLSLASLPLLSPQSLLTTSSTETEKVLDLTNVVIEYKEYESELQMQDIMRLIQAELSEPYSIYTYRYFIYNWPKLCFLAAHGNEYVGAIVCKLDMHMHVVKRGYIAMLAVKKEYRKLKIGTNLVQKAIEAMLADDADEVVLETEMKNLPALRLYENLGFVRDKRLFRYYLNGVDALRLKLWFR